jgi:hypothetical protein
VLWELLSYSATERSSLLLRQDTEEGAVAAVQAEVKVDGFVCTRYNGPGRKDVPPVQLPRKQIGTVSGDMLEWRLDAVLCLKTPGDVAIVIGRRLKRQRNAAGRESSHQAVVRWFGVVMLQLK